MNYHRKMWFGWLFSGLLLCSFQSLAALELKDCHVKDIKEQVLCGVLPVAENPEKPQGTQVGLNIVLLKGYDVKPGTTPLLILAGGPGQAATELASMVNIMLRKVRQTRDILMIDQRGTGKSNGFECRNMKVEGLGLAIDAGQFDLAEQAKECLAELKDYDLTQYSTEQAIDDFEAVRKALGYRQFHLYGGSYGTRAGLVYMRRYPKSVASAVLDSVAPTQLAIGLFGKTAEQAFDLMLQNCRENHQCAQTYPNLEQDFQSLKSQLEKQAVVTEVNDPISDEKTTLRFDKDKFLNLLRTSLYAIEARRMLPLVIHQASLGNYKPFLGMYAALNEGAGLYMGLTLTVVCSEDWPRVTPAMVKADDDNAVVGNLSSLPWQKMCPQWPRYSVDKAFAEPVKSDIPTLLLSGRLDPVTPPAYGEMAKQTLTHARHLVAYNGAHTIVSHTCAPKLIAQFLDSGDLDSLDDSCLTEHRPMRFMLNANATSL